MATSGTTSFKLNSDELIDEALSHIGGEHTTGEEAQSIKTSLNLLLIDLSNRKIPLSQVELVTQSMVSSSRDYTLDSDIVDVLDAVIQDVSSSSEIPMDRMSLIQYNQIPNKDTQQRPIQYTIDRQRTAPVLKVWPRPDRDSKWQVNMYVTKRIEDISSLRDDIDVSYRYFPALVAGLAYWHSFKRRGIPPEYRQELKIRYEELLQNATTEDRERVDFSLVPKINRPRY